jgi:hypothetical protein
MQSCPSLLPSLRRPLPPRGRAPPRLRWWCSPSPTSQTSHHHGWLWKQTVVIGYAVHAHLRTFGSHHPIASSDACLGRRSVLHFPSLVLCLIPSPPGGVARLLRHGLCRTVHAFCPVRLLVLMTSATTLSQVFTAAESFVVFTDPLFLYIFLPFLIIF